jgi:hypothetical protein
MIPFFFAALMAETSCRRAVGESISFCAKEIEKDEVAHLLLGSPVGPRVTLGIKLSEIVEIVD